MPKLFKKKKPNKKKKKTIAATLTSKKIGLKVKNHQIGVTGNPLDREFGLEYKLTFD